MDIAAQFGDNLVRVRKLTGVSQDELSIRASVHRTEISQLERGLRIPRIDTLAKLCAQPRSRAGRVDGGDQLEPWRCAAWSVQRRRLMAEGIRKRHSKGCAAREGRRCSCNAGYEASGFLERDGRIPQDLPP